MSDRDIRELTREMQGFTEGAQRPARAIVGPASYPGRVGFWLFKLVLTVICCTLLTWLVWYFCVKFDAGHPDWHLTGPAAPSTLSDYLPYLIPVYLVNWFIIHFAMLDRAGRP